MLQEVNRLLSVGHRFSSSYRPQSGGQTERSHRCLNDAISIQIKKNDHRDWDLWMYGATFAHNAIILPVTDGLTPFFSEFGRGPVMPAGVGVQMHPLLPLTKENYAKAILQRIEWVGRSGQRKTRNSERTRSENTMPG